MCYQYYISPLMAFTFGLVAWAKEFKEISILPAKDIYVALFIVSCLQQNTSIGRITDMIFGINWVHLSLGIVSPYSSNILKNLLETSKRLSGKTKNKKEPITPDHLAALVNKFGNASLLKGFTFTGFMPYWLCRLSSVQLTQ